MAKPIYNLTVPTIIETAITGFYGAIERVYRGATWRCELRGGIAPIVSKNGHPVALDVLPPHGVALVEAARAYLLPKESR